MSRKNITINREVLLEPKYNNLRVTKLINNVMLDGRKATAQKIVYTAFETIEDKTGENALDIFNRAMENVMPALECRARRVGGTNYQVPMEVRPARRQTLGLRWIVESMRKRGERQVTDKLANEIMDAANNTGASVRKKEEAHRMAEANKAFAHYRW
ncbi:MAG: 30S ribosomal protein S7 [Bacillota bacterium]